MSQTWQSITALSTIIKNSLQKTIYQNPMPVQITSIPYMIKNYDVAIQAQTGSGKTLAFLIPIINHYIKIFKDLPQLKVNLKPMYLILSPTRQLCQQTFSVLQFLLNSLQYPYCNVVDSIALIVGGSLKQTNIKNLQNGIIFIVATVGRLHQICNQLSSIFKKLQYVVIDQGDQTIKQKGFDDILRLFPKQRRTFFCSATLQDIGMQVYKKLAMRNPVKISVKVIQHYQPQRQNNKENNYIVPQSLQNYYIQFQNRAQKILYVISFIQSHSLSKCIIFFNTCSSVQFYTKLFLNLPSLKSRQSIYKIYGKMDQKKRLKIFHQLQNQQSWILIATNVVARGIDFQNVQYILQVDPPTDPQSFVHRIGRTARVSKKGTSILLLQHSQTSFIQYLNVKSVQMSSMLKPNLQQNQMIQIKKLVLSDRDYIQKARKAFVSYIRAYKEHQLKYIFEFGKLDIGQIGNSFFLLRLPRIKQILGKSITSFVQSDINPQSISFKDKNQQKMYNDKRQKRTQSQLHQKKTISVDLKNKNSFRRKIKKIQLRKQAKQIWEQNKQILKQRKKLDHQSKQPTNLSI